MNVSTTAVVSRRGGARTLALGALVVVITALLSLFAVSAAPVHADDNLPVYTSPIDITSGRIQIRAVVPDRETGQPVEVPLPIDLLGPKMNKVMNTPLGAQMDEYWNVIPDPKTGKTPRQQACDRVRQGLDDAVAKAGEGFSVYDFGCNLATKGMLLVKQEGSVLTFGYTLFDSSIEFYVTTPGTCHRDHGTFLCPNDPGLKVTMVPQLVMTLRTPALCSMTASDGTAVIQSPNLEPRGVLNLAEFADTVFFGGWYSSQAEQAIRQTTMDVPLPLDDALAELRGSAPCTDRNHPAYSTVATFRDVETEIDLPEGIIIRLSHPGIAAPRLDGPNPGGAPGAAPEFPSFARPNITTQPIVVAGSSVTVNGSTFPPTLDFATALPLTLDRDATAACNGGATELEWGPAGGQKQVQKLPASGNASACASRYEVADLAPATAYQFRARDCDAITCSSWSAPFTATTAAADPNKGKVTLTLDSGTALGTATVNDQGTFEATVTIPADTTAGTHTIHAVSGDAKADVSMQVTAAGGADSKATIVLTGSYYGETGCPTHPLPDYAQKVTIDEKFPLFGAGFAAGTVTVHLDSATGMSLGTATVRADGTFCQEFQGPPASQLGDHKLVAVQNGAVQATIPVTVIRPTVVR